MKIQRDTYTCFVTKNIFLIRQIYTRNRKETFKEKKETLVEKHTPNPQTPIAAQWIFWKTTAIHDNLNIAKAI